MVSARPEIREYRRGVVTALFREPGIVDRAAVDARRRAGLQAIDRNRQFAHAFREALRGRIAGSATGMVRGADMDPAGEKRSGSQHDRSRTEAQTHLGHHAGHAPALDDEVVDRLLEHAEVRLRLDHRADRRPVQHAVGLAARRAYRGALRSIQRAPLDTGAIRSLAHRATERVDLAHEVALADAANRRVAAHLADRFDAMAEQQRVRTTARRGKRSFGAGVATTDDDDVIVVHWESLAGPELHRPDRDRKALDRPVALRH